MSRKIRTTAVVTATLFFAVLATQAFLYIHLLYEEHHPEHDSHECPICQQLLALPHSITVEEQTTIGQAPLCEWSLIFHVEATPAISTFHTLGPRAPPYVC
jgi:hypothetical protein